MRYHPPIGSAAVITSGYLDTRTCSVCSSTHHGVDYGAPTGTPFYAVSNGIVIRSDYSPSYGNVAIVDHGNGWFTLYAHAHHLNARAGQFVKAGDQLGKVGSTGRSTGPHLHHELFRFDGPVPNVTHGDFYSTRIFENPSNAGKIFVHSKSKTTAAALTALALATTVILITTTR